MLADAGKTQWSRGEGGGEGRSWLTTWTCARYRNKGIDCKIPLRSPKDVGDRKGDTGDWAKEERGIIGNKDRGEGAIFRGKED